MDNLESLKGTCKQFLDSLLSNKDRHTLSLNIEADDFEAESFAADYLRSKGVSNVGQHTEPTPTDFGALLKDISGKTLVINFVDLDKHPKCIDALAEYVRNPQPGGKLVIVSRHWNSDNTQKERELRKFCLFYQQNLAKPPK